MLFKGKYKNIMFIFFIFFISFYLFRVYSRYKYQEFVKHFPPEYQIGQRLMISPEATQLTPEFKKLIMKYHIGNLKIYGRNYKSKRQLYNMIIDCQNLAIRYNHSVPMFAATDQEGGWIAHIKKGFTIPPASYALGRKKNKYYAYLAGRIIASELHAIGINVNFAPTVDVLLNDNNWVIGPRAYGNDPEVIVQFASEFIRAHVQNNVLPVIKHYPGIGRMQGDPHIIMITNNVSYDELMKYDLKPFTELLKTYENGVMIANAACPGIICHLEKLQKNNYQAFYYQPATVSPLIIKEYLINLNNYYGLIFSDELNVQNVRRLMSLEQAVYQSLKAGVDIVLINEKPEKLIPLINFLKKKYKQDKIFREQTINSLKKIIRYKAILFRRENELNYLANNYIQISNFNKNYQQLDTINNLENKSINRLISLDTVEINQNKKRIIPLRANNKFANRSFIIISSKEYVNREFNKYVEFSRLKYIKIKNYYTDRITTDEIKQVLDQVDSKSIIIITVISRQYEKLIRALYEKNKNIIVINILHATNIKDLKYIDTIMSTYSDNQEQVTAAIEVLFKGRNIKAKEILKEYLTF